MTIDTQPLPTAAQISLQTFHLPAFPPEAASLKHLTLTSDIKPTDYADLLSTQDATPPIIPPTLPKGIQSLTLELFSLGYPAPFLTNLGKSLPNLKDLTLYSHLIDGVSDASRRDAGEFIRGILTGSNNYKDENENTTSTGLRELHLLDVFCRKGFIKGIGDVLHDRKSQGALRFLEVSYTYRGHSDGAFLDRIPVDELPRLLVKGLVGVSLRLDAATAGLEEEDVPDDPADVGDRVGRKPEGIVPVGSGHDGTGLLVERLDEVESDSGSGLKMLDCTLYALSLEQLGRVLRRQRRLAVLSVSVLVSEGEDAKKGLLETLRLGGGELEVVEVVGVPGSEWKDIADSVKSQDLFRDVFPSSSDMLGLAAALPRLESFSMTILRAPAFGSVSWVRRDGQWVADTERP
ncbi:hypothetical protein BDV32DRAFT_160276 [Aspergillus pseudonomiae]|uniref:Uncharacterized protein n=1 Tax=Aspergillus pseudonomiae TaxID=1506151 RepID=A0A5N6HWL7_9EURO|nr:uncharacterized protein BDV37DRAFT_291450 [Aspergillus pseudonomiae]KAB8258009.1 hypothetical protein BDV32DRAFT_160276 [Aspergillus pseudonomiae]KAE8398049.1 hypothetical protein BDV37DRAFT_291450 [Aspergillus pseudonomiae]